MNIDIGTLIAIFIAAALVNNLVFSLFLGICPFLGVSRKVDMAFGMGCAVTFVITLSGMVTWLIVHAALVPLGEQYDINLNFLKYVIFIMVIASMVQLVEMYVRKFFPGLYTAFGVFLPLITTNCAILGACLFIDIRGYTFLEAITFSFAGGLGFALAITIMAGIREHISFSNVPKSLQGPGITLLIAAILAMSFMGFAGMMR
ncbi:MAG: electron transport complex protein RnfA [Planctomycetota bacterium]|jgi:electron transport complex protein RnfA